ncbi:MAG: hypothetical protein ACRC8Q_04600, partial [Aeromonas sp.]
FKSQTNMYNKRVEKFNDNMAKAYALVLDKYCTKGMRERIDEKVAADATITNDPLKLLVTINTLMQEPIRDQNPGWSMEQSLIKALSIKQSPNESIAEYAKRFQQNSSRLKQLMGTRWADGWAETTDEYGSLAPGDDLAERQEAFKAGMVGHLSAIRLIKTADPAKYSSLVTFLNTQYNLKSNQWLTTTVEAIKLLSAHRLDNHGRDTRQSTTPVARGAIFAQTPKDYSDAVCHC